jgi:hypothetical protein
VPRIAQLKRIMSSGSSRSAGGIAMYTWLWRKLPGGLPGKIAGCTVLALAVVALLFYVVFPWVDPRLPFNQVTINQ